MALYEKLSASSSPEDIAAAYKEFTGLAGGDTAAVQKQAVDYLTALGIGAPTISQAYGIYQNPVVTTTGGLPTTQVEDISGGSTATTQTGDTTGTTGTTGALTQATTGLTGADTLTTGNTGALTTGLTGSTTGGTELTTGATTGLTTGSTTGTTGLTTGLDTTSGLSALNNTAGTGTTGATTGLSTGATTGLTTGLTKTYTQAEVDQALADTLATDANASRADLITAAATLGITANQVDTALNNLASTNTTSTTGALTQATQANEVYIGDNRWLNTTTGQITTDWNRAAPAKTIVNEEDRNGMHFRYYSDGSMDSSVQSTGSFLDFVGDVAPNLALQIGMVMAGGPAGADLSATLGSTISNQLGLNLSAKAAQALGAGLIRGTLTSASGGDFVTGAITGAANTGANLPIGDTGLTLGNIGTAVKLLNANDAASVFSALASDPTLSKQTSGFLGTEATNAVNTGLKINNIVTRLQNGQNGAALTLLGELASSPDTKLAGAALSAYQAIESGGSSAQIANALLNLSNSAGSDTKTSTSSTSTSGLSAVTANTPLTDEEIADLTPDQLRVYQESGVSGLRDYNRAIKNMTSLTTSGFTGDVMGGNDTLTTTGGLTGGTSSLTGTGALSTATNLDDFENSEITRLRGLGMSNAQISAYLENLNNLTASLDATDTSGLSDFGLAAFRQAKAAGATDVEALAAANLAISGKYPTNVVETDTSTGVELVVTDTNGETNIYSFYETQTDTGVDLIVTSGRETGQETETTTEIIVTTASETESESETETEIIVTTASETGSETETEIIVTTGSETQSETETETITETEIVVTTSSETQSETVTETETETEIIVTTSSETQSESETETETETEIIVTTSSETQSESETETETETEIVVTTSSETQSESETETETETEIVVTTSSETKTETETETETETVTETEIIVTTSSETLTETETETETITEIVVTDTLSESETETETFTPVVTKIVTKPPTISTPVSFTAGTPATGGSGKPIDFLKENLLKTYMTKQSFKDPLAEFTKARTDMMKENMMQQGVDPRLAAILAAKMNGTEPPPAPAYNYGEEPSSIEDILSLKGEGDQYFAQGGYVQPLMAQGGMALPLLAAKGGLPTTVKGREDFRDGKHVAGEGDGQSDDIPAMLADGEFVFPADVVSALGNGSTKAGTDKLYEMMHSIRDRARSKGPKDLPPPAFKSPLDYLKKR